MNNGVIRIGCSDSEDDLEINEEPDLDVSRSNRRITRSAARARGTSTATRSRGVSTVTRRARARGTSRATRQSRGFEINNQDVIKVQDNLKPDKEKKTVVLEDGLEVTLEDDSDEEIEQCIRVIWSQSAEVNRFNLKPSETVLPIFDFFSKKYDVPIENIKIRNGDSVVSIYDTVDSLKLKVTQVLEAYTVKNDFSTSSCRNNGAGKVEVKCLLKTLKKPLVFYLHQQQNVSCLLTECAKEIENSVENLVLKFDGEKLELSETPASLGLEGGECFDVHVTV